MTSRKPIKSVKKQIKDYALSVKAKCCYCGRSYSPKRKTTLDHVVPKSSKGTTDIGNLLVCCSICNSVKKKSIPLDEFIKLNPKTKYFLNKYLNKMKGCIINDTSYFKEILWIKEYF